jgi:hypothetical protein
MDNQIYLNDSGRERSLLKKDSLVKKIEKETAKILVEPSFFQWALPRPAREKVGPILLETGYRLYY